MDILKDHVSNRCSSFLLIISMMLVINKFIVGLPCKPDLLTGSITRSLVPSLNIIFFYRVPNIQTGRLDITQNEKTLNCKKNFDLHHLIFIQQCKHYALVHLLISDVPLRGWEAASLVVKGR